MNTTAISVGKAQILLGRLVGLSVVIALFAGLVVVLKGDVSSLVGLLPLLLISMVPATATLGLLFAGQRRVAGYVSLLGAVPCTALFLLMIIPLTASGGPSIGWLGNALLSLPFFYTAITLARAGVGVRVTSGERRQARQLRAARRAAALTVGPAEPR